MSEIIDSYEQDLIENLEQASKKINQKFSSKQDWKQYRSLLTECEKGIKLLQTQIVGMQGHRKAMRTNKLKGHKKRYDQLKKITFQRQNDWELEMNRRDLMNNRSSQDFKTFDRSTQATQRLRQSVKLMRENQEIGDNVANQLVRQSEIIVNNKGKLVEIRHQLGKSERKINSMMLRIRKNKFVLRGVIIFIVLVFIIVIVSYFS